MTKRVNPTLIAKEFGQFEGREALSTTKTVDFTVEVYHHEASLFKFYESTQLLEITSPPDLIGDVEEAIDRCRSYNLKVEFMPSVQSGIKSSYGMLETKNGLVEQKNRMNDGFRVWLEKICSSVAKVYFIPDTNFLMRQYYSGYLREILSKNKASMFMRIPRLGILEVENKYDSNKPGDPPKETASDQNKQKIKNN